MTNRPVIVLGLGPAGLFLVRQLSNITSNIYAVGRPDDVGMFSKYIEKRRKYYAVTAIELEDAFKAIRKCAGKKPELYICSDQYLSILLEKKERWGELVELAGADFNTLALINDKNTINDYCQKHNVKIPLAVSLSEYRENPFYPAIIKWVEKRIENAVNPIGKVKVCYNKEEFEIVDKTIRERGIQDSELFVQFYIEGKNDFQYSVGGYYQTGEVFADVVVKQVKQQPQGISAEVVTTSVGSIYDDIHRITESFAKELQYSGFLETEYKVDANTGEIYLLDANPRPWGWISILGTVYSDFYQVLNGNKPKAEFRKTVWKSPMRILAGKKNKQNVKPNDNLQGYLTAYDIKDRSDPMPSLMIYLMAAKKLIRRIKG